MELRQLRHFIALAEAGNFHRAAAEINMAQPPLSVSIRKLEEELNIKLFERHPRGVTLTQAGDIALGLAREIMYRAQAMGRLAGEVAEGKRGQLSVAFVTSATFRLIPRIVPAFRRHYPNVELRLKEASSHDVLEALAEDSLDVGVIRTPVFEANGVKLTTLAYEELVLAVPEGHRLATVSNVRLEDLADEPFITFDKLSNLRNYITVCCEQAGFLPRVVEEVVHVYTMVALVESGMGVALLASSIRHGASHRVRYLPVTFQGKPMMTGLTLARRDYDDSALVRNFEQCAQQIFQVSNLGAERADCAVI